MAKQWDTNAAFLYADVEKGTRVLIKVDPTLSEFLQVPTQCWCIKAAYGLPSAPAQWQKRYSSILTDKDKCGATRSLHDQAVFIVRDGDKYVYISTHVDDFCVFSNCKALYEKTRDMYFSHVDGEEGDLDFMLGVNFDIDFEKQTIKLRATTAINKVAARYGAPARSSKVPMLETDADLRDLPLPVVDSVEWVDLRHRAEVYRSMVPAMLYIATTCRPDIAFAIGILCRCLDNPTERHIEAAFILLAYLIDTPDLGVQYTHDPNNKGLHAVYSKLKEGMHSLSDSDWSSGKSISGYVIMLAMGAVMWASKKQPVTALSSTEAEYYAASSCGVDTLATQNFKEDLTGVEELQTPVFVDNSGAVSLAKNFNSCKRAKRYTYIETVSCACTWCGN